MPMYEYQCSQCGRQLEMLQKFSDPPATTCECGGPLQKLLSKSSFQLKGTGWYVTDYKKKPADGAETSEKKEKAKAPVAPAVPSKPSTGSGSGSSGPAT